MIDWLNENRQPVKLVALLATTVALVGATIGEPLIFADQQFAASRTGITTSPAVVADAAAAHPRQSFPSVGGEAASIWLHSGSTGDSVTAVQSVLAGHGWTIAIDGAFGPQTEGVVTRFQEASGLLADGIVGPVTWAALESVRPAVRGTQTQVTSTLPPPVSAPVDGVCESWRPLVEAEGIPWDWALPIMRRESGCNGTAHNGNRNTGDHSHGLFQINILGSLGAWYSDAGYTHEVVSTAAGAIKAAGALYAACGPLPWQKPNYGCSGDGQLRRYVP